MQSAVLSSGLILPGHALRSYRRGSTGSYPPTDYCARHLLREVRYQGVLSFRYQVPKELVDVVSFETESGIQLCARYANAGTNTVPISGKSRKHGVQCKVLLRFMVSSPVLCYAFARRCPVLTYACCYQEHVQALDVTVVRGYEWPVLVSFALRDALYRLGVCPYLPIRSEGCPALTQRMLLYGGHVCFCVDFAPDVNCPCAGCDTQTWLTRAMECPVLT
eukprot:846291-Rhodomonas_salina.2